MKNSTKYVHLSTAIMLTMILSFSIYAQENDIKGEENRSNGTGIFTVVGPDTYGYTAADETEATGTPYNFIDITATGTSLAMAGIDDGGSVATNIGFNFNFYGTVYTQFAASSNGYVNFNPAGDLADWGNDCPSLNPFDPDQSIYVYWDDLEVDATGDIFVETFVTCPETGGGNGMCTIVQWHNVNHLGDAALWDIELILYDTGNFLTLYPAGNSESGDGATIGIENQTPSNDSLDYACNTTGTITDDRSVLFCAPGNTCPFVAAAVIPPPVSVPSSNNVLLMLLASMLLLGGFFYTKRKIS